MRIAASDVAHFDPAVIADIRGRLGQALASQELDGVFVSSASSVFDASAIDQMFSPPDMDLQVEGDDVTEQETSLERRFAQMQRVEMRKRRHKTRTPHI